MSDQSLRDALGKICDDYIAIDIELLRETLAAHPAVPAPLLTDEAVEAAARAFYEDAGWDWSGLPLADRTAAKEGIGLALEAAEPYRVPKVDREALARILWLGRHLNSRPAQEAWPELASDMKATYLAMADAVLALINGTAK